MLLFIIDLLGIYYGFKVCGGKRDPIHPTAGVDVGAPIVQVHTKVSPWMSKIGDARAWVAVSLF